VVLSANTEGSADELATRLGERASAASVADAISQADAIVFAVWLDAIEELIRTYSGPARWKVVIDPSNPITADGEGGIRADAPRRRLGGVRSI
jgi:predicted dinucleotide-binding enzyme